MPAEEEVEEEGDGRQGAGAEGRRVEGLGGRVRGEVVVKGRLWVEWDSDGILVFVM